MEYQGITKRELFAAMAMQGFLASAKTLAIQGVVQELTDVTIARASIGTADALLAELAKPQ